MGDILSKLQMVSEKIGVTETAHTIEEQVDLISESLDKVPHSTNIAEALDDLSEVAQNINNEEVYVDKTITANGEYLPASDEATAYSKVTVNVPVNFNYIAFADPDNQYGNGLICKEDNGSYKLPDGNSIFSSSPTHYTAYLLTPVNTLKPMSIETGRVAFTPAESFELLYSDGTPVPTTGDTVTPGDGKLYYLDINYDQSFEQVVTITKTNRNFQSFIIN